MQRLGACSRPLSTLFSAGAGRCRSAAYISQPCSLQQSLFLRGLHHHSCHYRHQTQQRVSTARLFFSSKSASNRFGIDAIFSEIYSLFESATLFLPRVVAFYGTIHVINEYGFNTVSCEGPSMEPTIIDGSFTCVLIEKFSHRIFGLETNDDDDDDSYNFSPTACCNEQEGEENIKDNNTTTTTATTWLTLFKGIWEQHLTSGLQRGDVIILHHPCKEATICKRIIGLPGDTIIRTDGGSRESNHRVKVSPGHLWIEGDSTLQSHDSRAYGDVPASLIIGKVVCRLWPLKEYASLGLDANGMEHWQRVRGRIGRGERPLPLKKNESFEGSHVLMRERKC